MLTSESGLTWRPTFAGGDHAAKRHDKEQTAADCEPVAVCLLRSKNAPGRLRGQDFWAKRTRRPDRGRAARL